MKDSSRGKLVMFGALSADIAGGVQVGLDGEAGREPILQGMAVSVGIRVGIARAGVVRREGRAPAGPRQEREGWRGDGP